VRKALQVSATLFLLLSCMTAPTAKAVSGNPTSSCGTNCVISFSYTGDYYQWTAPTSGNFVLEVWGAQGGNAQYNGTIYSYGGPGGFASGTYVATAGQVFYIYVGGQGTSSTNSGNVSLAGGFNGGGSGFNATSTSTRGAGGGGGTDIRVTSTALANRIIVAGGGGGSAYDSTIGANTAGVGGGTSGGDGFSSIHGITYAGKGGTSISGGARGNNCNAANSATTGTLGQGGRGEGDPNYSSGGGGGGYWGGGGSGCQFAGGGGSGYIGSLTSSTLAAGNASMPNPSGGSMAGRTGNGFARITYPYTAPTISLSSAGNAMSANKGIGIVLTAGINVSGYLTFYANKKRIPKCINLAASSSNTNCTWNPAGVRSTQVYATLSQSGSVVATSPILTFSMAKRTGLR
jgi:hypothetical protein